MNDYERIAAVIRQIDASYPAQPSLESLASSLGLSASHFHRLFSRWAGLTPKDFLQSLTAAHARRMLRDGCSVLDTALGAGLSGPGRLHDLTVSLEAASPGEWKSGGAGLEIAAGWAESPFGPALLAESTRGLCFIAFADAGQEDAAWQDLCTTWPRAEVRRDDAVAESLATRIFQRPAQPGAPLRAYVRGTQFQVKVWRALLAVPAGAAVSYRRLATAIGQPTAARAVGSAVGANSLAYIIPCHRVLRETGVFGEYRWGPERKRAMAAWESARLTPA